MTQSPPGWYPEPDPSHVGPPGRLRYWDGARWTEHVHEPQAVAPAAPAPPAYPEQAGAPAAGGGFAPIGGAPEQAGGGMPTYPSEPAAPYGQQPVHTPSYDSYQNYTGLTMDPASTTPDGVPLAGWWQRVLASLLDFLIMIPLFLIGAIPVVASQWGELTDWFDDLTAAADNGAADPPAPALFDVSTGAGIALVLSTLLVSVLYNVLFLHWKQATPGKLIVGLRVRRRDNPDLPPGTIGARVGFVTLLNLATQVIPLFFVVGLLDLLWPLWDKKKQALHDKVAGTNVVRIR